MKKVSVIIVTYNSEKHIYDCLASIFKYNDIGHDLEVIVVDNCSLDFIGMKSQIEQLYGEKVRIIANDRNGGYGQGNNVGCRASSAPIIMIINPDVRLCEPVIGTVYSAFEENPKISQYGFTQRNGNGQLGRSVSWTARIHPYIAEPLRYVCGKLNIFIQRYMYVSGACFFLRKSAFEEAGLFDENIFLYNEEDDIHGRLLKNKSTKIVYNRQISYMHLHPSVKDYSSESYNWLKSSIKSLIYFNERDGISRNQTIDWAIKRTNISILGAKIMILYGKEDASKLRYFKEWKDYLKSI